MKKVMLVFSTLPEAIKMCPLVNELKSSLMIFDRHANLKYKYGNRHFWARGYYMDTVGAMKNR